VDSQEESDGLDKTEGVETFVSEEGANGKLDATA